MIIYGMTFQDVNNHGFGQNNFLYYVTLFLAYGKHSVRSPKLSNISTQMGDCWRIQGAVTFATGLVNGDGYNFAIYAKRRQICGGASRLTGRKTQLEISKR